jgi:hypothetical protein
VELAAAPAPAAFRVSFGVVAARAAFPFPRLSVTALFFGS